MWPKTLIRETHGIKAREKDVKTCLDQLRTENNEDESENKEPSRDKEALKNGNPPLTYAVSNEVIHTVI